MNITKPAANTVFTITAEPSWPSIVMETDRQGPHTWDWTLAWDKFSASGTASTPGNAWDARTVAADRGGTLTVKATAGGQSATVAVRLVGKNPTKADVASYVAAKPDGEGFEKIVEHETHSQHFGTNGEPKKSFDKGYGICQLTNPAPTFEQVWNWRRNVDAGVVLFAEKRKAARTYLSQSGRTFTDLQLRFEAVCRWNGGAYHRWDGTRWVRNPNVLCDSTTGNIGWDMTDPENAGKTEAQLHARDSPYTGPPGPDAHWKFFGICYADRVLG